MKIRNLLFLLILFISTHSFAQKNKAYAITGQQSANLNWVDIREIDLSSGTSLKSIFVSGKNDYKLVHYGGEKVESFSASSSGEGQVYLPNSPTQSMIAAAAYDQKRRGEGACLSGGRPVPLHLLSAAELRSHEAHAGADQLLARRKRQAALPEDGGKARLDYDRPDGILQRGAG